MKEEAEFGYGGIYGVERGDISPFLVVMMESFEREGLLLQDIKCIRYERDVRWRNYAP